MSKNKNKNNAEPAGTVENIEPVAVDSEKKFTKSAFLMAKKYKERRDLLGVLLKDDVRYSNEEVETLVCNYLKKEN